LAIASLETLEATVVRDLELVGYPEGAWVPAQYCGDAPVLDVLIAGGGQSGLAVAAELRRARVTNILVVDEAAPGGEGIWRRFARMKTLRTHKKVTGPDMGVPNLTFQAWYEAQHGAAAFAALGKIDKGDWHAYLAWFARVLALPVRNHTRFEGAAPEGAFLRIALRRDGRLETVYARKLVLAMGIESSGRWWMPPEIEALPKDLRAHAADAIDFAGLAGRRVAVIGAGASAFDNAATALEHGAAEVVVLCRRRELQRVQPYKAIANPGFLGHFASLPDAMRWRLAHHLLTVREAFPKETWERARMHANFRLATNAGVLAARAQDGRAVLTTPGGDIAADFVIAGTGFDVDLAKRPELAGIAEHVATWGDRYVPPAELANPRLARYPYLDARMAFMPKVPGAASWLDRIHCFNFGATASFGPSGASISAMKFAAPHLARGIVRDLFCADIDHHAQALLAYAAPEFDPT
jgi:cation diffusion facilitator CzcD-associated flavoprotein CzcO